MALYVLGTLSDWQIMRYQERQTGPGKKAAMSAKSVPSCCSSVALVSPRPSDNLGDTKATDEQQPSTAFALITAFLPGPVALPDSG